MKKYPHRFDFPKLSILWMITECPYSKMGIEVKRSIDNMLVASVCWLALIAIALFSGKLMGLGIQHLPVYMIAVVTLLIELLLPIPLSRYSLLFDSIHTTELKDEVEPTSWAWIYFYYIVLRNYPMLSMTKFIGRIIVWCGIFAAIQMFIPQLQFLYWVCFAALLYYGATKISIQLAN